MSKQQTKPKTGTDASQQAKIEAQLDQLQNLPAPQKRIWEIDFLRGVLILFVVFDHFLNNFLMIRAKYFQTEFWHNVYMFAHRYLLNSSPEGRSVLGQLRLVTHDAFVYLFVLTSGISSSFSRSNLKRGIKMAIFAALFTGFTYAIGPLINTNIAVAFNVIHVIASSVLILTLTEFLFSLCKKTWQKNLFGGIMLVSIAAMLAIGHYFKNYPNTQIDWSVVIVHNKIWRQDFVDYLPLLPSLGWFFVGVYLGKMIYKQKTTLFPIVNEKYLKPITFIGRHSLWFYFGTQVVMFGLLYFFAVVLNVM